ncbi:phage tail protein [Streptomyces sp. DT224]|uniref:phage tail protein n=1 Tax=Streptomyces sp. DT224 TaxID=3393426 RepID=UPI003CF14967
MKAGPEKPPSAPAAASRAGSPPTEAAPAPTPAPAPAPDRRGLQRLQRAAGNAAVSRLVAQRYTAPVKPSPAQAPGFRGVKADIAAKRQRLAQHRPAATESKASQDAAVAPPDDKEAQGKAANAEKMNAAKPGEFDKKAFIDAVNKAIDAQAPKNLDDADKFSKSGKAERVKAEVDGKVSDGKQASAKDIDTATKAPPDTSAAKDKPVTPLTPDQPPGNPGAPSAAAAIPEKQPASVTDFSEGPAQNDKAMADAEVTEEQLAKGNEPEFNEALSAKKTAEADSAKAPAQGRSAESRQLSAAKAGAAASGAAAMSTLTATRAQAGQKVDGGKGETKSKDEKKRAEVTAKLQKVYDGTKKDVEATLSGLDQKVDAAFTSGEKAARDAFTADHKRRMKKYKDKRYSGWTGKARWVKDKFAGLPEEANSLYQEARKLYVSQMQTVISSVADIIGTELGKAKARIAKGRGELKAEVDNLPADLRQFGEEAEKDFAGKFDDLEATVNEKSEQLVQDLAQKYTAALNKVDEEIKKLQEANKGLIDKAKDAIVGAIKTINELKNLLLGILAKAAGAIMKIIKDPIGFLGNLVSAVSAGLNLFITNIAGHLKTGLVSWLLGTAVKAGLELPQKFDMKGIIQLIGSLLGLTWDNIRARVTRKGVPEEAMTAVESSVPVAQNIAREGPAGAVKEIQEEAGDLKSTILEKLTSYLIPTVIIAGITWILSLLNPASAFVRAVKGIIDIVTFVVNQGAQIVEFVNSVLDAVVAIANGGKAGVPKMVETALAASVPLLIGFLASLLGIGSLAAKVKSVFHAVSRPVNRAIDKIVDFVAKKGKALWLKLRGRKGRNGEEADFRKTRPNRPGRFGVDDSRKEGKDPVSYKLPKTRFRTADRESHTLLFKETSSRRELMVHSTPVSISDYLSHWKESLPSLSPPERATQESAYQNAFNQHAEVIRAEQALPTRRSAAASHPNMQSRFNELVLKCERLAEALALQKKPLPPLPPPVLPPFRNSVLATDFTAHYIAWPPPQGQVSTANKGLTLKGWHYVDARNLQGPQEYWLKMHLLPGRLGGMATDSNLVPARQSVNNPDFLTRVEEPAHAFLASTNEHPENPAIWYRVKVEFGHGALYEGFPSLIDVSWGTYDSDGTQWIRRSTPSGSFADPQAPPPATAVQTISINTAGEARIAARMGGEQYLYFARQVVALRKNSQGMQDPYTSLTDLEDRLEEWDQSKPTPWADFPTMLSALRSAIQLGQITIP